MESVTDSKAGENKGLLARQCFAAMVALILIVYWQSFQSMFSEWWDNSLYTHSWLSSALFFYAVWSKAKKENITPSLRNLSLPILFFGGLLWWIGVIVSIAVFQHLALYILIVGVTWLIWGWSMIWSLRYMFVVMALAIPLWQVFQHPLRYMSTEASYALLKLLNVPVFLEDFTMTVPGGRFHVEPACAGLAFLLSSVSLVFVYGAWNQIRLRTLTWLLALSCVVAILANWIRILVIIIVGNYTNMQSAIVQDHLTFGWILFVSIFGPVFWLAIRNINTSKGLQKEVRQGAYSLPPGSLVAAGFVLVVIFPAAHSFYAIPDVNNYQSKLTDITDMGGFQISTNRSRAKWEPEFVGAKAQGFKSVRLGNQSGVLYLAEYPVQTQESELINVNNHIYNDWVWKQVDEVVINNSKVISLQSKNGQQRVIAYCYIVAGKKVFSEKDAKLMQLRGYFDRNNSAYAVAVMLDHNSIRRSGNAPGTAAELLEKSLSALQLLAE